MLWADGSKTVPLPGHVAHVVPSVGEWTSAGRLVTGQCCGLAQLVHIWSSEGERLGTVQLGRPTEWHVEGRSLYAVTEESEAVRPQTRLRLRSWTLPDGTPREHGTVDLASLGGSHLFFAPQGRGVLYAKGREIRWRPLPGERSAERLVGTHSAEVVWLRTVPGRPDERVSLDRSGEIRVWRSSDQGLDLVRAVSRPQTAPAALEPDPVGRFVALSTGEEAEARLWDLDALPGARPLRLRRSGTWYAVSQEFHPDGKWLAATTHYMSRVTFWPLRRPFPSVVEGYAAVLRPIAFSPDGRWLASNWPGGPVRLWPLPATGGSEVRTLDISENGLWVRLVFDPKGRFLLAVGAGGRPEIAPLDGSPARRLPAFGEGIVVSAGAVSPSGRLVATAATFGEGEKTLRVWNVDTAEQRLFPRPEGTVVANACFVDEATLVTAGPPGVLRWDIETGAHAVVAEPEPGEAVEVWDFRYEDGSWKVLMGRGVPPALTRVTQLDPMTGEETPLLSLPAGFNHGALGPESLVALAGLDGVVRVGRAPGGPFELLTGHEGPVARVAVSPDGRWVASTGDDNTLRLWPMPDLSQPPLHTLPRDQLLAKLKSLTNVRAVRDAGDATGWAFELAPFPGWETVPDW
jgi:WD40 repeat protein